MLRIAPPLTDLSTTGALRSALLAALLATPAWAADDPPAEGDGLAQDEGEGPGARPLAGPGRGPGIPGPMFPPPEGEGEEGGGGAPPDGGPAPSGGPGAGPPPGPGPDEGAEFDEGDDVAEPEPAAARQRPPAATGSSKVTIDFVDAPLSDVIKYMAEITGRNFILTEELKGTVTIISHQPVSVPEAYEAFLSAMEMAGFTTVTVGQVTKVVGTTDAANTPLRVYEGDNIPYTDNYVTQIIQLENVSVTDISSVVKDLAGKGAKVIAYAPTNTLIITDAATNIRRVYRIVSQLDVAAPKSKLEIIGLRHATAADVERIIKEVYAVETTTTASSSSSTGRESGRSRRSRRRAEEQAAAETTTSATKVGAEGKYIEKVISDERTNSIVVMANEEALTAVKDLVAQLDVDVDPTSRAQIQVVYLEHAKAEEVAQVLSNLSQGSSSSSSSSKTSSRGRQGSTRDGRRSPPGVGGGPGSGAGGPGDPFGVGGDDGDGTSAVAAFDSGLRITSDESTNSLVIIATPDQFAIIRQVIEKLDIRRQQVFVEAVILELASEDSSETGVAVHAGNGTEDGAINVFAAQLNASSLGVSAESISGAAMGVYGPPIDVQVSDGSGGTTSLPVPAFGIALNALQSNSAVNILSTPNILTMDNEEAKIVVGRNIPFPVSTSRDNNGQPIVSYQREDVAITLKVTPQINESNFVTLEVFQEVQEIEEDSQGLDVSSAGFITSKRSVENTVVVKDNQTVVIGGLIGETETEVETKIPVLGDMPLLGGLFRGSRNIARKTNLLVFLTPHVIDDPADLEEVYRVKWAQRKAFIERFYGKSRQDQESELGHLLSYSMNLVDERSRYRGPSEDSHRFQVIDSADPAKTDDVETLDDPSQP